MRLVEVLLCLTAVNTSKTFIATICSFFFLFFFFFDYIHNIPHSICRYNNILTIFAHINLNFLMQFVSLYMGNIGSVIKVININNIKLSLGS